MNTVEKPKRKPVDEKTLRVLAEGRLKGLEIRRKKAELKKLEKAEQREQINKAYEEKVLKKKNSSKPTEDVVEETDKEIYEQPAPPKDASESDDEREEPVKATKAKQTQRKPKQIVGAYDDAPNYKNEYYRLKLERIKMQEREAPTALTQGEATLTAQQSQFQHQYASLPPQHHAIDIARNQLHNKVNQEVYNRVFKDLFNC